MKSYDGVLVENLLVRIGLVIAAAYAFWAGMVQWTAAADMGHPWVVLSELATYIIAILMLFVAVTGIGLSRARHLILVVFIAALYLQAYFQIESNPSSYGTDAAAFTSYSAFLFWDGTDPYGLDMEPSLGAFNMPATWRTAKTNGTYELHLNNPAYSFLVHIPFIAAGLGDARITSVVFYSLILLLLYVAAPPLLQPLVMIPFFIDPEMVPFTTAPVTDVLWAFFLTAAAVLWRRRNASALFYGLAISSKQQPWILIPFLIVRLWNETEGNTVTARLNAIARYLGIAEAVFLFFNGYFLLSNPRAWFDGILAPMLSPLIMDGQGLSILSQSGLVYAPQRFYSLSVAVIFAALLLLYWIHFDRLRHALWLLPAIVLWFSHRSFQSYFVYWIPPLIVSLYPTLIGRDRTLIAVPRPATGRRKSLLTLGITGAVAVFVGGGILVFSLFGQTNLQVMYHRAILDSTNNTITELEITVRNNSAQTLNPVFWIKETGHPRFYWQMIAGPEALPPNEEHTFILHSTYPEYEIPVGTYATVQVNDVRNPDLTGFGPVFHVAPGSNLSLANADFFYWTRDWGSTEERPFGWGLIQVGSDGSRFASVVNAAQDGRQCTEISVIQQAGHPRSEWLIGYLDQWVEFPEDKIRVPVYPTFPYQAGYSPVRVMGIEVRDDTHRLWYIFSNEPNRMWKDGFDGKNAYQIRYAPLNEWSDQVLDIAADYAALQWPVPESKAIIRGGHSVLNPMINFRLFVATRNVNPETYSACFGPIIQHLP